MEKAKERIYLLHIKNFTEMIQSHYLVNKDKETDFGLTTIGTGKLDLKGILGIIRKVIEIGLEYAIVEQDRMLNLSIEDSFVKETGYIE